MITDNVQSCVVCAHDKVCQSSIQQSKPLCLSCLVSLIEIQRSSKIITIIIISSSKQFFYRPTRYQFSIILAHTFYANTPSEPLPIQCTQKLPQWVSFEMALYMKTTHVLCVLVLRKYFFLLLFWNVSIASDCRQKKFRYTGHKSQRSNCGIILNLRLLLNWKPIESV